MPAITLRIDRICRFLGRRLDEQSLAKLLPALGMSVEEVGNGYVKAEYNPNRPDFSSHMGVARALQGIMGIKLGPPRYSVKKPGLVLKVEEGVKGVRPYVVAALVRGLKLSQDDLDELIAMQEDLHWVIGRNRRKVAIGLHDYSRVRPPITYKAARPDSVSFTPLWEERAMKLREIIENTEAGRRYGYILEGKKLYPLLVDASGNVLSFPPIINSRLTELSTRTRDLFVDVTGTDVRAINNALNVLVSALADMGGEVYSVEVRYKDRRVLTPNLANSIWRVDVEEACKLVGVDVGVGKAAKALMRMRLGVRPIRGGKLLVAVPPYRTDIMHQVDFAEELAMGIGFENIEPELPSTIGFGMLRGESLVSDLCRETMIGLGFTEAVNTTLSNSSKERSYMRLHGEDLVKIMNPVSAEYDALRAWLLPGLLTNLAVNKRNPYPQRLFEVGDVVEPSPRAAERVVRKLHLCGVICHASASYSEIKSVVEEVCRALDIGASLRARDYPYMIEGRSASLVVGEGEVGFLGEVHPEVLENFQLAMPTAAFELDLSTLLGGV